MLLILLHYTIPYSIPIVLLGSLLVAGLAVGLITALDYRTWVSPAKSPAAFRIKPDRTWGRPVEPGGCILFLVSMMLLISMLSVVLFIDGMFK